MNYRRLTLINDGSVGEGTDVPGPFVPSVIRHTWSNRADATNQTAYSHGFVNPRGGFVPLTAVAVALAEASAEETKT